MQKEVDMKLLTKSIVVLCSFIKKIFSWLYSYIVSLWFNFTFLPFHQARYMPIWIEKIRFYQLIRLLNTGEIKIESEHITPKMIKLGVKFNSWNPYNGVLLQVYGKLIFEGAAVIGNNATIYIANGAVVRIGKNFKAGSGLRLICQKKIIFGEDALIGWNSQFADTDFHNLYNEKDDIVNNRKAPIIIGRNNWFGCHSMIFKGFESTDNIVYSAGTICKKRIVTQNKSILGNSNELITILKGTYYDKEKDGTINT